MIDSRTIETAIIDAPTFKGKKIESSKESSELRFDGRWNPRAYLKDYYSELLPDEVSTMAFLVENLQRVGIVDSALVFGVGPTLHHVFPAAPHAESLSLADFLPGNLKEIDSWLKRSKRAWNWRPFVEYTLNCESKSDQTQNAKLTPEDLLERENLVRSRTNELLHCDASHDSPLAVPRKFPLVLNMYCCDSATSNPATYQNWMRNVASLVENGGHYFTAALRKSPYYLVGGKKFPSANVSELDVKDVLSLDFDRQSIIMDIKELPDHRELGYDGIILAYARKPKVTFLPAVA